MMNVTIDNQQTLGNIGHIKTMPDLVEYIKATIDPDRIITGLALSGQDLSEADWRVPLSVQGENTLEVKTGRKHDYVAERLKFAPDCMQHVVALFERVRADFEVGKTVEGNSNLGTAVNELRAFLEWYQTILAMFPSDQDRWRTLYDQEVTQVSTACKRLIEQQLYQSWWALGETLKTQLIPQLQHLEGFCTEVNRTLGKI